jgi:hypothetical protein
MGNGGVMYWSPQKILSYGSLFSMVVGARGVGKSVQSLDFLLRRYIDKGEKSIYLRRYRTEADQNKRIKLFDDVLRYIPRWDGYEIKVNGKRLSVVRPDGDGKPEHFLTVYCLSEMLQNKGTPEPDVKWIFFDEFILPRGRHLRYLPDEFTDFLSFYETVDRKQSRVRVIMAANAMSLTNPYFIGWGIEPDVLEGFRKFMDGELVVEFCQPSDELMKAQDGRWDRFIKGTSYAKMSQNNEFMDVHKAFIQKKSSAAKLSYGIKYAKTILYVWADRKNGEWFISEKGGGCRIFSLTKADMDKQDMLLGRADPLVKSIAKLFQIGKVRFESQKVQGLMFDIMTFIGVK